MRDRRTTSDLEQRIADRDAEVAHRGAIKRIKELEGTV